MSARRFWSPEEDARLAMLYPDMPSVKVAHLLARSLCSTYNRAQLLGLTKSAVYLASPAAGRTNGRQGIGTRFERGHTPANKGLRRPGFAPGRMQETQFRKGVRQGVAVKLYKPIGTERMSKDGYLERKINDDLPPQRRWRAVHLVVWEGAHGPLARGHAVVFKNGDRSDIRLDNLECITRAELMGRNTVHNLPAPLPQMVQLLGALNRKINRKNRNEEQDRGSTQPPVRSAGRAGRQGKPNGDRTSEGNRGCGARDRGLGESGSGVSKRDGAATGNGLHRAPRGSRAAESPSPRSSKHALVAGGAFAGGAR